MLTQMLLPDEQNLAVEQVSFADEIIMVQISSTHPTAVCPDCQQPSVRVHSRYQRTIADLAWADKQIELHWQARRFFCDAGVALVKPLWNGARPWSYLMLGEPTDWLRNNVRWAGWLGVRSVVACRTS
jgi:transposase